MTSRRPDPAAAVAVAAAVVAALVPLLAAAAGAAEAEWNIARIGAPASANRTVIAVVDTGVDAEHPAFTGRVLPAIDLVGGDGGDPHGHGTHVAGTAAGADNGCGAIGVAPDASILPVRVLEKDVTGSASGSARDVAEGIRLAADAGATVINLSLGSDVAVRNAAGSGLEEAIRYAWSKGSIAVLAAGNDGIVGDVFGGSGYGDIPAVVVTATDNQDRLAPYATTIGSAEWGVAAPGGDASEELGRDIFSAFPDRRCALQAGTSMAAPHVSGALAVLRARGLGPREAVERLLTTARDLGREGPDGTYGHGLIDLRTALAPPPPATATAPAPPPAGPAPAPTATTGDGAPQASPTTVAGERASRRAGTSGPTPNAPVATDPAASDEEAVAARPDAGDDRSTTTSGAPADGSAAPVVVRDADDGDDGVPGSLVAAAVAALAVSGVGAGALARTLNRRPGSP